MSTGDPNDFMTRYERERAAAEARARELLRYVSEPLRLIGVRQVKLEYDGYGDEGDRWDIVYLPPPPDGLPDGLEQLIEQALGGLLPGGWEINEGSFGTLNVDTATGEFALDHTWNEEDPDADGEDDEEGG